MEKLDKDSVNAEMVNDLLTQGFTLPEAIEFTNQLSGFTGAITAEVNRLILLAEEIENEVL